MADPRRPKDLQKTQAVRFCTYNIRSGRGNELAVALRAMEQMNMDFGVFQETKVTRNDLRTRFSSGYQLVCTDAAASNQGGVALFYRESDFFSVESVHKWGPNVISFILVMGGRKFGFIGGYIPPDDTTTIQFIQKAVDHQPEGMAFFLMGDLNANLHNPVLERDSEISALVASHGLEDALPHFRQRSCRHGHGVTWWQRRADVGIVCSANCDYLLASDRRFLRNVQIQQPRLHQSDHFALVGVVQSAPHEEHRAYLRGRKRFPLQPPKAEAMSQADTLFTALKSHVDKAKPAIRQAKVPWISGTTWKSVDTLTSLRRERPTERAAIKHLQRQVRTSIKEDRKVRTAKAGERIEDLIVTGDLQTAWDEMKVFYREASDRPPKPSRIELGKVTAEYTALYEKQDDLPEETIPVLVGPVDIPDHPPSDKEIEFAVRRLRTRKAPGPSGMSADHLKAWMRLAIQPPEGTARDTTAWEALCGFVRHVYATGELPVELSWATMILLPKGDGQYRGIGLLEITWKLLSKIIDRRIRQHVTFHDAIHGFRAKRGCGTATIEAKLLQQLATVEQAALFKVFLDLRKAYDTLDRSRTLEILALYGLGKNALRLLETYWAGQRVVAKQSGYYGEPFGATRGVTQGDIISPTIFNIVSDAVVRYWLSTVSADTEAPVSGVGVGGRAHSALFYADDGEVSSRDPDWLQGAIDVLADLFGRVGLKTNTDKTEVMICHPGHISHRVTDAAYGRRLGHGGLSFRERNRQRVECPICKVGLAQSSLSRHMQTRHGQDILPVATPPPVSTAAVVYKVSFPKTDCAKGRGAACPVDSCGFKATTWIGMRYHFQFRHPKDSIHILNESPRPYDKCGSCGIQLKVADSKHRSSKACMDGAAMIRQRGLVEAARKAREVTFTIYGQTLRNVETFKYLGRPMSSTDGDAAAVFRNISLARQKWARCSRILARDGATAAVSGMFYRAIVQTVLLFSSETWVVTPTLLQSLESFHHAIARRISGKRATLDVRTGVWKWPPIAEAMELAGLKPIAEYIRIRQDTIAQYVATRPIMDMCNLALRRRGNPSNRTYWWTQAGVYEALRAQGVLIDDLDGN